jgi:hypothetical protein
MITECAQDGTRDVAGHYPSRMYLYVLTDNCVRLGYSEPCEVRSLAAGRTLTALHASSQWRRYAGQISAATPADVWREGCWRFAVYPGAARDRRVDIVFAVYLQTRRPPVRVAVLDADTDEILGRPELAAAARS